MAEAGWHPKREASKFEPPPWEREQFEALQKARREDADVVETPREPVEPSAAEETLPAEAAGLTTEAAALTAELAAARERADAEETQQEVPAEEPGPERPAKRPQLDAQLDAMLIQLGAEEPKVDEHLKPVGLFGSTVAMFFGVCMMFWGLYALLTARGAFAAVVGALIVLFFGALFGGLGLWVGWRVTNRGE